MVTHINLTHESVYFTLGISTDSFFSLQQTRFQTMSESIISKNILQVLFIASNKIVTAYESGMYIAQRGPVCSFVIIAVIYLTLANKLASGTQLVAILIIW